jgi:hypothetical protein
MMAGLADYPIVFLDVDGTLIPFRARPAESAQVAARTLVPAGDASGSPLLDRLDPADGRRLLALGCQLVWATTWMADANDLVAPRLGLPELPVVEFPEDDEPERGVALEDDVPHPMGSRAHVRLARRRNNRRRPAMGSSPLPGEGFAAPR